MAKLKLNKIVGGCKSFRYSINGKLTKYNTAEITQKQLSELAGAGAEFVIEEKTKKIKKKSNDENKTDNSDID